MKDRELSIHMYIYIYILNFEELKNWKLGEGMRIEGIETWEFEELEDRELGVLELEEFRTLEVAKQELRVCVSEIR